MYIVKQLKNNFCQLMYLSIDKNLPSAPSNKDGQEKEKEKTDVIDYKKQKWYKELSIDQQVVFDKKVESKLILEKRIAKMKSEVSLGWLKSDFISKWIEQSKPLSVDSEDKNEILSFEMRVDLLNLQIAESTEEINRLESELALEKNVKYEWKDMTERERREKLFEKSANNLKSDNLESVKKESREAVKKTVDKWIESLTIWDVYMMKQEWYDISKLFLVSPAWNITKDTIKTGDELNVNFWTNRLIDQVIWAWDLLPIDKISEIEVNWVKWFRWYNPRPWYYTSQGEYLAIHNNYKIKIISEKPIVDKNELDNFKNSSLERYKEIRTTEIVKWISSESLVNKGVKSIKLPFTSVVDLELLSWLAGELWNNLKFDKETQTLSSTDDKSIDTKINMLYGEHDISSWVEKWTWKFKPIDLESIPNWVKWLLDFLAIAEWTNWNYNAIYWKAKQDRIKYTDMTLDEVLKHQKRHSDVTWSSAFWRYQFMRKTLEGMIKTYHYDRNRKFDEKFQDEIALRLMEEIWLKDYLSGKLSKSQFQFRMAWKWASLPKDASWLSYHHWDSMKNHATVSHSQFWHVLDKAKMA